MSSTPYLLPSRKGNVGFILLNNPSTLNALNIDMIHSMNNILPQWQNDPTIKATIVTGAPNKKGKPCFCSGGDVKSVSLDRMNAKTPEERKRHGWGHRDGLLTADFFRFEYQTNYYIATQPQPQISIWDGVVMGGGVGVSIHGKYRIVTENTMFAMPETAIGLFPDVGGMYWLPRLEAGIGEYISLTGKRLTKEDCIFSGIATHFVPHEKIQDLQKAIVEECNGDGHADIESVLSSFRKDVDKEHCFLSQHQAEIEKAFLEKDSVHDIIESLQSIQTEFASNTLSILSKVSPSSVKVTHEAMKRGKTLDIGRVLKMEYRLSQGFMRHFDFYEGIRALLIDKDQNPKWKPNDLRHVSDDLVAEYFESLGENELDLVNSNGNHVSKL